jgi:DNA polymerase-3 subunit alpha
VEITGFEHLHLHSHFSLLDGYGLPDEYAARAKQINQKFLTISDHGVMGAVPRQIKTCEDNKISPIFACELYVNPLQTELKHGESSLFYKDMSEDQKPFFKKSYHLLGIAYNVTGYSNLVKLSTLGYKKGFYYKPRVNRQQLVEHKEGIIFTSCCYNSEIGQAFDKGGEEAGFKMVEIYKNMFHDKFYLEMMLLDFKKQKPYDVFIMKAAERYGLPLIITNDCHVCLKEDMKMQSIMMMMQMGKTMKQVEQKLVEDGDVFEIQDQNLWMKSEEEINEKWLSDYQDVMDYDIFKQAKQNTVKICELAKGVEFQIDRTIKFPSFENDDQKLLDAIKQGFEFKKIPKTKQYFNRIKEEYELIKEKGFCSYFLVQKMITDEARRVSPLILGWGDGSEAVGPGRGCLKHNTPIRLKNGSTNILKNIKVGDKIWTVDGTVKKVLKTMKYPFNENVRKIRTYYGDEVGVTLTLDHKIYAEKSKRPKNWDKWSDSTKKSRKCWIEPTQDLDWFQAQELSVGDWCFVPFPKVEVVENYTVDLSKFSKGKSKNGSELSFDDNFVVSTFNSKGGKTSIKNNRIWSLNEDWAFILGVFVGDGWTNSDGSLKVGFCDNSLIRKHINEVCSLMKNYNFNCKEYLSKNKSLIQTIFSSPYLRKLFDELHPEYEHTSHSKYVPDCILNAPVSIVESYLRGYFLADGYEDEGKAKFETVSYKLAEQIRFLLLRIGLPCSIKKYTRTDLREDYKNISPSYVLYCPLDVRIGCSKNCNKKYVWRSTKDGLMLRIKSIKEIKGPKFVYDLEIEDNHNYLTSSFLVHNSIGGSLVAYALGLIDVDPIKHDLLFSRFLSPARGGKSMKIRFSSDPIKKLSANIDIIKNGSTEECPFS